MIMIPAVDMASSVIRRANLRCNAGFAGLDRETDTDVFAVGCCSECVVGLCIRCCSWHCIYI